MAHRYTSWEEAEFRQHRAYHYHPKSKKKEKKMFDFRDELKELENELRTRFLIDNHEGAGSADKSVRALKYFCNCLGKRAHKNTAGGNRFCKRYDNPKMSAENRLIAAIINPVSSIAYILTNEYIDYQQLLDIKNYVVDIQEEMGKTITGLMKIPFYQEESGFMNGAGHNPAFKDVMIQLLLDAQNEVYGNLANRIEQLVQEGRDPFSYKI